MLTSSVDSRSRREREICELLAGQVNRLMFPGFAGQARQPCAPRQEIRSVLAAITDKMKFNP